MIAYDIFSIKDVVRSIYILFTLITRKKSYFLTNINLKTFSAMIVNDKLSKCVSLLDLLYNYSTVTD